MGTLEKLQLVFTQPWPRAALILTAAVGLAFFFDTVGLRLLRRLAQRTKTDLDDDILTVLRRPTALTILLFGLWLSLASLALSPTTEQTAWSLVISVAVVAWMNAGVRISTLVLGAATRHRSAVVQDQTRPVFEMSLKVLIVGVALYLFCQAWGIDVTAWVAGAGVTGIVIGLAAQDTLSNLFAGLFILTDAPFKLGDFLTLQDGTRGRVADIGLRSTRIVTNNFVEIIIPNAQLASGRITNESGGSVSPARIGVMVGVAYGVDLEAVRAMLLEEAASLEGMATGPRFEPKVRFMNFGESSLDFQVLVWPAAPAHREDIIDVLNSRIYKRLMAEGIEIPFPKRDVYLHDPSSD